MVNAMFCCPPRHPHHHRRRLPDSRRISAPQAGEVYSGDEPEAYAAKAGTPTMGGLIFHLLAPRGRTEAAAAVRQIPLSGFHSVANVTARPPIAAACNINPGAVSEAVGSFKPTPHRIEFVRQVQGVDCYNDSIATAPRLSMTTLSKD